MKHVFGVCVIFVLFEFGNSLPVAVITKYENDVNNDGYHFQFETSDGIRRSETGQLFPAQNNEANLRVTGEYGYYLPDGSPILVTYTASEDGYRPRVVIGKSQETNISDQVFASPIPSAAIASLSGGGIG